MLRDDLVGVFSPASELEQLDLDTGRDGWSSGVDAREVVGLSYGWGSGSVDPDYAMNEVAGGPVLRDLVEANWVVQPPRMVVGGHPLGCSCYCWEVEVGPLRR